MSTYRDAHKSLKNCNVYFGAWVFDGFFFGNAAAYTAYARLIAPGNKTKAKISGRY